MKPIHFFYPDPDPSDQTRPSDSRCRCATEIDAPAVPDTDRDERRPDLGMLWILLSSAVFWTPVLIYLRSWVALFVLWACAAMVAGVIYGQRPSRADRRAQLSRAVRDGDAEAVKRLTRELAK